MHSDPQIMYMVVPTDSPVIRAHKAGTELPERPDADGYPVHDDKYAAPHGEVWPCRVVKVAAAGVTRQQKLQPHRATARLIRPLELISPVELFGPNHVRVIDLIERMSGIGRYDIRAILEYDPDRYQPGAVIAATNVLREQELEGSYRLTQQLIANKWRLLLGHKTPVYLTQSVRCAMLASVVEPGLNRDHFDALIKPLYARSPRVRV